MNTEILESTLKQMKFLDEVDSETKFKIIQELNGFDTLADIFSICHSKNRVMNPSQFKLNDSVKSLREESYGGLYYKYYDSEESTLDAIRDPSIRFQYPKNWNDIFESNYRVKNQGWMPLDINFMIGSCFSTKWDNLLMWSHYGKSCKGFCVGYQIMPSMFEDDSAARESELWPVAYYQIAPSFPPDADALILSSKSIDWAYEDEYRLLIRDHIPRFYKIKPDAIREIIIGSENDNISILNFSKNIRAESELLKIYQAKKAHDRYGLVREEIV